MSSKMQSENTSEVLKELNNNCNNPKLKKQSSSDSYKFITDDLTNISRCTSCKLEFWQGDPDWERRHMRYHNAPPVLRYKNWKKEIVVGISGNDRIILVESSHPKTHVRKVMDILKLAEGEIGSCYAFSCTWKVFLYIRDDLISAILIGEPATFGYRVKKNDDNWSRSEASYKVLCGINRIWTYSVDRKNGIATKLINCLRKNFVYGKILTNSDIAFSVTNEIGHLFCRAYCKNENYLVYTGSQTK